MLSVSLSPLLPFEWTVALGVAALLGVVLALLRGQASGLLRALAILALFGALLDPAFVREDREKLTDIVAVVIDRSSSQRLADRTTQTNRVREALDARLAALPGLEVKRIEAADDPGGDGTRLFSALQAGLVDVPAERVAAVILVTDGVVHDIPANAEAFGLRAPVHALVTGRPGERDRRIELLDAPRFGIVGRDQTIELRVADAPGALGPARLLVRRDGDRVTELNATPGTRVRVPVRIDHAGTNVVEIETPAIEGELTDLNNKVVVPIEGVREKLRVLLVSGEPHAGERTWRNVLKADANVDLVHFTILRPPEKQDGTPINELSLIAFPTRELFGEKVKEFDLIIFDRYSNQTILPAVYLENIARYVREGGAVLVAAGPEHAGPGSLNYTPLGAVMPARPTGRVVEQPFHARVTQPGERHPVTRDLPGGSTEPPAWGEWLRLVSAEVRAGHVVMSGANQSPLLVLHREGRGRVALLLSDHAWLWARGYRNGGPHLDLLRRLGHWLMKEPELEEEALRASSRGREVTVERQSMGDVTEPVLVRSPTGRETTLALSETSPGLWRGRFETGETGLFQVRDARFTAFVNVGVANTREFAEVVSDTERLRPFAEATGGSVRRVTNAAAGFLGADAVDVPRVIPIFSGSGYSGSDWIGIKPSEASVVRGVGVLPVFLGVIGLLLLLGSLAAAWLVEGRRDRTAAKA